MINQLSGKLKQVKRKFIGQLKEDWKSDIEFGNEKVNIDLNGSRFNRMGKTKT